MSNISKIRVNEIDYDIIDSSALHDVATDDKIGGIKSGGDISIDKNGNVSVINSVNSINLIEKTGELLNCGTLEIPVFIQNGKPIETNIKPSDIKPKVAKETAEAGTLIEYSRADHIHPVQKNVEHSDVSTIAEQLGEKTIGDENRPIYLSKGKPIACDNVIPITNIETNPEDLADEASPGDERYVQYYSRIDHVHRLPNRFNKSVSIGSETQPVYFEGGKPIKCSTVIPITDDDSTPEDLADEASPGDEKYVYSRIDHVHKLPNRFNKSVSIGSETQPVYFEGGKPIKCSNVIPITDDDSKPEDLADEASQGDEKYVYSRIDHVHKLPNRFNKSVSIGSKTRPVYFEDGIPMVCDAIGGGGGDIPQGDIPITDDSNPVDLADEASPGDERYVQYYSRIDHVHKLPNRFNKSVSIGSKTRPVYFEDGIPMVCDIPELPESKLPEWYQPSIETNENLSLSGGDSFVDAFSKLEKAIIDNELISTNVTENIAYSVGLNDKLQYVPTGAITSSSKNISEAIKLLDDYISTHTNLLNTNSLNTNSLNTYNLLNTNSLNTNSLNTYQQNYTETYEWKDGNPDNEDRTGYFVKLESGKLIKCSGSTGFILGITTSTNGKFSTVSLIGTNIINQDGTLVEGEYCTINKNGIATKTTTQKYYVLNIINKNKAKIIFK